MALDFYRTVGGRQFIDRVVPGLKKSIDTQNELLTKQLEQQDKLIEQNQQIIELLTRLNAENE